MIYRILTTIILVCALIGVAALFGEDSSPSTPTQAAPSSDDASMKSFKIN